MKEFIETKSENPDLESTLVSMINFISEEYEKNPQEMTSHQLISLMNCLFIKSSKLNFQKCIENLGLLFCRIDVEVLREKELIVEFKKIFLL